MPKTNNTKPEVDQLLRLVRQFTQTVGLEPYLRELLDGETHQQQSEPSQENILLQIQVNVLSAALERTNQEKLELEAQLERMQPSDITDLLSHNKALRNQLDNANSDRRALRTELVDAKETISALKETLEGFSPSDDEPAKKRTKPNS